MLPRRARTDHPDSVSVRSRRLGLIGAGFFQILPQLPVKSGQVLECGSQLPVGRTCGARFELGSFGSALSQIGHCGGSTFPSHHMPDRPAIASTEGAFLYTGVEPVGKPRAPD